MLRVKVCGITRPEDARTAAELGADAIGLVFHPPSPRVVTTAEARAIVRELPPWVARIGVFVNAEPTEVRRAVEVVGLTGVQLHGEETLDYIEFLNLNIPVIKAISVTDGWERQLAYFAALPILLDTAEAGTAGGTGRAWDYTRFRDEHRPSWFILAGGLNPSSVADAVTRLRPNAVDVSTGVETAPGKKDAGKIAAFMGAVAPFRSGERAKGSD
jgi:phosphoribosylanthranilate isomerase